MPTPSLRPALRTGLLLLLAAAPPAWAGDPTAPAASPAAAPAPEARDLAEALDRLGKGAPALLVYAHGSNWNIAGEEVLRTTWAPPALAQALPPEWVRVAVDIRDPDCTRELAGLLPTLPSAPVEMLAVEGKEGSRYAEQADGSWLMAKEPNPHNEDITLRFRTGREPVKALRVQFLRDAAFGGRLGRAGNFAVNEMTLALDGKTLPLKAALADACENNGRGNTNPRFLADGDAATRDRVWSVNGVSLEAPSVLLVPQAELPANSTLTLTLQCRSPWGQHTPGRLRLGAVPARAGDPALKALDALTAAALIEQRNRALEVDTVNLPSLTLYDAERRKLGTIRPITPQDTPASLAARLRAFQQRKAASDALLAEAKAAGDPAQKIEKTVRAALALGDAFEGEWRKQFLKDLSKLDPQRQNPWMWHLDFNIKAEQDEAAKIKDKQGVDAAIAWWDQLARSPRAAQLANEQRQRLLLERYLLLRDTQDERRFQLLEDIAKVDGTTHLGIGARGQINYHGRGIPTMGYGWWPRHVQAGDCTITLREGLPVLMPVSGAYRLILTTRDGSSDAALIRRVRLVDGAGKVVSAAEPQTKIGAGSAKETSALLTLPPKVNPADLKLEVDLTVDGGGKHSCTVALKPALPDAGELAWKPLPPGTPAAAPAAPVLSAPPAAPAKP